MLEAGERIPDSRVWLGPRDRVGLHEVAGDGPILLFFYLFDWSAT